MIDHNFQLLVEKQLAKQRNARWLADNIVYISRGQQGSHLFVNLYSRECCKSYFGDVSVVLFLIDYPKRSVFKFHSAF